MSRAKRVALGLVVATLVLLAAEAVSRLVAPAEVTQSLLVLPEHSDWLRLFRYDPLLFFSLRPNLVGKDGRPYTNSLGLRGPEVAEDGSGEYRILSIGESTTFGGSVPYEECYSSRVEAALATVGGKRVRVVNAGVPAYTSVQGAAYLEHRGLALGPRAVLVYFGYNDFLPVSHRARRDFKGTEETFEFSDLQVLERRRTLLFRIHSAIESASNLYRIAGNALREAPGDVELPNDRTRPRVPESDRAVAYGRMRDLCAARSVLLVVVVPWYPDFADHAPFLREFAAENGLSLVDLPRELASLPAPAASYFKDAVHPTAEGHRLIAEAILSKLPEWVR